MIEPRRWTLAELERDAEEATSLFREERLKESLNQYSDFFEHFSTVFRELVDRLPALAHAENSAHAIIEILSEDDARTALRYLAAPLVSDDDLKTLAETKLSATALRNTPENAHRVAALVLRLIDPHRFPWIAENRLPTSDEVERAVVASAALVATQKVSTSRRSASKVQEDAVKDVLRSCGFIEDPSRPDIETLVDAPASNHFRGESKLGRTKADIVARLPDQRLLAIECKVSNSAVNSYKRVNHEAVGKARSWLSDFGRRQIVPAAVLSGVFKPANLATAQDEVLHSSGLSGKRDPATKGRFDQAATRIQILAWLYCCQTLLEGSSVLPTELHLPGGRTFQLQDIHVGAAKTFGVQLAWNKPCFLCVSAARTPRLDLHGTSHVSCASARRGRRDSTPIGDGDGVGIETRNRAREGNPLLQADATPTIY